jgi:hypothetical protein
VHVVNPKKDDKPKKDEVDSVDEEKKAGVSDPSRKLTKGDSPNSVVKPKKDDKPKRMTMTLLMRRRKLVYQIGPGN